MTSSIQRREFLQLTAAATAFGAAGSNVVSFAAAPGPASPTKLISPGCRRSKVKVARLYMGHSGAHWPTPKLNLEEEVRSYQPAFDALKDELADVDFFVDQVVSSPQQVQALAKQLKMADGILVIQVTIGISSILAEVLKAARPTVVFAIPYSGHEWAGYGQMQKRPEGELFDAILTTDRKQLAVAIRPFRAIHHLREAKIVDVTTRLPGKYAEEVKAKFGTEIKQVGLQEVVDAYNAVSDADAQAETDRWLKGAAAVVEPSKEEVFKACKQALAFERMLAAEDATVLTVDCYGSMWDKTIKLPAYPCLGFSRLNSMGLGGICESDLRCAMTHIIFQGLAGKPGFVSDPTMDESQNAIVLAHCMGTVNMQGPGQKPSRYKLRTVMERQQGVVPQVFMPVGPRVTQAILIGMDTILYFTGEVIDAPDVERGCRTKITVKVDGSAEKLWKNWTAGLHRSTCYGDISKDLERFCRFMKIKLVNEAV